MKEHQKYSKPKQFLMKTELLSSTTATWTLGHGGMGPVDILSLSMLLYIYIYIHMIIICIYTYIYIYICFVCVCVFSWGRVKGDRAD